MAKVASGPNSMSGPVMPVLFSAYRDLVSRQKMNFAPASSSRHENSSSSFSVMPPKP